MVTQKSRKVIITGTGHPGSLFLVELLTELGLDTGHSPGSVQTGYDESNHALPEQNVEAPASPYIVENPALCAELPGVLARGHVQIDHALIPIRHAGDTAAGDSRRGNTRQPKTALAENFHALVETLVAHEIPHTFLHFPRFACDPAYTFAQLQPLLGRTPRAYFDECFARVARPQLILAFDAEKFAPAPVDSPEKISQARGAGALRRVLRSSTQLAAAGAFFGLGWFAQSRFAPAELTTRAPTAEVFAAERIARLPLPAQLPPFRSPPLHMSDSLDLASLELFPERWFPSGFGPMHLLNRPRRSPPLFFRAEMMPPDRSIR